MAQAQPTLSELRCLTAQRVSMSDLTLEVQFGMVSPLWFPKGRYLMFHLNPFCAAPMSLLLPRQVNGEVSVALGELSRAGGHAGSEEWEK